MSGRTCPRFGGDTSGRHLGTLDRVEVRLVCRPCEPPDRARTNAIGHCMRDALGRDWGICPDHAGIGPDRDSKLMMLYGI